MCNVATPAASYTESVTFGPSLLARWVKMYNSLTANVKYVLPT